MKSTELAALWQSASSQPLHGMGCGCSAPVSFNFTPSMFELDVIDYVTGRHGLESNARWMAAIDEREANRIGSFPSWLDSLLDATLTPAMHALVIRDVIVVLQSRIDHASFGRPTSSPDATNATNSAY